MKETYVYYLKPADVYRYCCPIGSWPISKSEAAGYISGWTLDDGYSIEITENELVKIFSPVKPE